MNSHREHGWLDSGSGVWLVTAANVSVRSLMRALEDNGLGTTGCLVVIAFRHPTQTALPFPHDLHLFSRSSHSVALFLASCRTPSPSFLSSSRPATARDSRTQITSPPTDDRQANLNNTSPKATSLNLSRPTSLRYHCYFFHCTASLRSPAIRSFSRCLARRGSTSSLSS